MAMPRKCVVKLHDAEGVEHAVQVEASSLYEAAFAALRHFRGKQWSREAGLEAAVLQVEVWEPPTVYKVSVNALEHWLQRGGGSPREVALRHKIHVETQRENGKKPS